MRIVLSPSMVAPTRPEGTARRRRGRLASIGPSLFALALAATGCAPEPLPYEAVADNKQLMTSVLEPAAEVYWDAVGTIMDIDEGTTEIRPRSDEEWQAVRDAAYVIAESGNLLMVPGRVQGGEDWTGFAREMIAVGRRALTAAEARNPEAVFDVGGDLYLVCSACHEAYAPDTLRPNFVRD